MAQVSLQEFMENITEANSSIVMVNQTTYNIQEHWLKLAATYFNIDTTMISTELDLKQDEDRINLLKAGLFGYFNEIASSEIKSAVHHRNVLYEEHFLNSASFPESIFNFAKLYNIEISTATPSHMLVVFMVRKEDLINSPLLTEVIEDQYVEIKTMKTYQLVLDRNYEFSVDKYKFLLPYDVQVILKQNSSKTNDFTITARYDIDKNDFPFMDMITPEIKVYQDITNNDQYVYLELDIFQLTSNSRDYTILSEDISDNLMFTSQFENQLATFNVYYEYDNKRYLLDKYFNNTFTPEEPNSKYCYYTFVDDDKVQVSFSSIAGSFRPRYNSKIVIETLTTFGQEGNFQYTGEILFNFTKSAVNNSSKMLSKIVPLSSASGGKDRLTTSGEKQRIIQAALGRDCLIMDTDLDEFFTTLNNMDSVNKSHISFLRKRDDVLMRIYSAFLLMRDKDQKALPTNTASSLDIRRGYFEDSNSGDEVHGLVIPEHSVIQYNTATKKYEHYEKGLDASIKEKLNDKNNLIYINPFLTKIDVDPVLRASYYKLDINETFSMSYSYINNIVPVTLLINKVNIVKSTNFEDDLDSDTYEISFELNSNETINDLDDRIRVRGVLLSRKNNEKYGYFEFRREDKEINQSRYSAKISTNRKFNNNKLSLSNSLYDADGEPIENQFIDEELYLKVGVLYKDSDLRNNNETTETDIFNDAFPKKKDNQDNINDFVLGLSVTTMDTVRLYRDLTNIMSSIATYIKDSDGKETKDFNVEQVPLVSLKYFQHNHIYMYNLIESYISILDKVTTNLENNTNIDLKFVNTFGPSKYWYLAKGVVGDDTNYQFITRTDFILDLTIHLYQPIDDGTDVKIKQFISDFVEASNTDGVVAISNLTRLLEENFAIIRYIEFNGLAGQYEEKIVNKYQVVQNRSINLIDMTKQEIIDHVPEYINIKKELIDNSVVVNNPETSEDDVIQLQGKSYEHVINLTYDLN